MTVVLTGLELDSLGELCPCLHEFARDLEIVGKVDTCGHTQWISYDDTLIVTSVEDNMNNTL